MVLGATCWDRIAKGYCWDRIAKGYSIPNTGKDVKVG
jgi:hypothetical protein